MKKKKPEKHPKDMANKELAAHVFHPKILKHAAKHIEEINNPQVPKKSGK